MFIDASAVVAILGGEPDCDELLNKLEREQGPFLISPIARFEAVVSLAKKRTPKEKPVALATLKTAREAVDYFVTDLDVKEMTISSDIGRLAIDAAMTYGKTINHPADLNLGDCFAYACAKANRVPLFYKG